MSKEKSGFTLIELLIVVAIIAILAAIAIPNFLAAQVRSKVSRARADLRSLATALEAYNVDNNEFPIPFLPNPAFQGATGAQGYSSYQFAPDSITTPIAYISNNKLDDTFAVGRFTDPYSRLFYQNVVWNYANAPIIDSALGFASGWADPAWFNRYGHYKLGSLGPDRRYTGGFNVYDPTNGTVSNGDIMRTQRSTIGEWENL